VRPSFGLGGRRRVGRGSTEAAADLPGPEGYPALASGRVAQRDAAGRRRGEFAIAASGPDPRASGADAPVRRCGCDRAGRSVVLGGVRVLS